MIVLEELAAGLPADSLLTASASTEAYRFDEASFCAAGAPLAVVRPTETAQVQHVLRVASAHRVPVVPQGARSGLSGAANAVDGGIVLNLTRMDRILEIDPVDQVAVVEPGVLNAVLSRAVLEQGMYYPPDPSSWEMSTIGGNLATNAGGLCCVKYGVTADFVRGLEVVTATGELLRTGRRTAKGVAGYDLTRLIVGSEGTLGVITQATLGLRPAPEAALTMAAAFASAADALSAVTRIMAAGLQPSLCEFLDEVTVRAIQDYRDMGLPTGVGALLLTQSDRGPRAADDVEAMGAICSELGALDVAGISARSALGLAYLVVFGSILAFSAYVWLLRTASTALVATYAYVNPIVAVALGAAFLDEGVGARTLVAGGLVVGAVALIVSAAGRRGSEPRESSHGARARSADRPHAATALRGR